MTYVLKRTLITDDNEHEKFKVGTAETLPLAVAMARFELARFRKDDEVIVCWDKKSKKFKQHWCICPATCHSASYHYITIKQR